MTTEYSQLTGYANFQFAPTETKKLAMMPSPANVLKTKFTIFLSSLANNYPQCVVRADRIVPRFNAFEIEKASLHNGEEELGSFRYGYHGMKKKIGITNEVIDSELLRDTYKHTDSVEQALKIVNRYCKPRDTERLLNLGSIKADKILRELESSLFKQSERLRIVLRDTALEFVIKHEDMFCDYLASVNQLETYFKMKGLRISMDTVKSSNKTNTALVIVKEGRYIVQCLEFPDGKDMAPQELPIRFQRNMGILKLTEAGTLQDRIGLRVDETTFIVKELV